MIYFVYQSLLVTGLVFCTFKRLQNHSAGHDFKTGWNLALILMLGGFIGGRLFHVLYEYPEVYWAAPLRVLKFWEGGFVFFGGVLLALPIALVYLRQAKQSFWTWADFYAPVVALGYALGRFGCFLAGCCYGTFCDAPWAIEQRHPTQLYAMATELALYFYLIRKEKSEPAPGKIFALWLIGHGLGRLFMENFRADFRGGAFMGLSISSWLSLILFSAGLAIYLGLRAPNERKN